MDAPAASARGDPTQPAAQNVSIESRRASQCSAGTWQNPPPEWPSVAGSQWVSLAWPKFTSGLWRLSQKRSVEKFNFGWSCIYVYMNDTPTFWFWKKPEYNKAERARAQVARPTSTLPKSQSPSWTQPGSPSFFTTSFISFARLNTHEKSIPFRKFTLFTGGVWFYRAFAVSHIKLDTTNLSFLPTIISWSTTIDGWLLRPTWKKPASGTKIWKCGIAIRWEP